ncbi:MAG: NAD(P)/FAD-dependent oxidoreductase [Promethearchaeota archaeon]|nr:MAG: NAD(P)/FAD-dependent oxidoreductase [Candidatus Lokiarchaeota archaeon]
MKIYKYLIIGGGMTTKAAIDGIRSLDADGSIGVISEEKYKPYERPPLSKGLWKDKRMDDIFFEMDAPNVSFHLSTTAKNVDRDKKVVTDSKNHQYKYSKLLIATGVTPKKISDESERIIYYKNLDDFKKLRQLTKKYSNFGIIGGGFIGSEIAAALTNTEKKVTMFFIEKGVGGLIFPEKLAKHLNDYYENHGVSILSETSVTKIHKEEKKIHVQTMNKDYSFDVLVIGVGAHPDMELLKSIHIDLESGVKVDQYLRTSDPNIYAAGDVANFYSPDLEKRIRVEHEDGAYTQGEIAGKNMTGAEEPYNHLPFFYSDLYDYGYEAIGTLNSNLEMIEDWKKEFDEGVVYYRENGIVVGVLLWNVWDQVDNARELIASKKKMNKDELCGYLPK